MCKGDKQENWETILTKQKYKHVYTTNISSFPAKDLVSLSVIYMILYLA